MLTIFICSRLQNNKNSELLRVLTELNEKASNPAQIEVLLKFDDDDTQAPSVIELIEKTPFSISVRHFVTPRGLGYNGLHHAYEYLYLRANPKSRLFWVLADDVKILNHGYDAQIFAAYDYGCGLHPGGAFVIHQENCFASFPPLYPGIEANGPENWPIWTDRWLYITGGFGLTMCTDAWTSCIEAILISCYNYDPRILLKDKVLDRHLCPDDLPGSHRFEVTRRDNIQLLRSKRVEHTLHTLARSIYLRHLEAQGSFGNIMEKAG